VTVLDYWRWAYSDPLGNTERGALAEFIVGILIGAIRSRRTAWDSVDLLMPTGHGVEVKSAAYWQTWPQERPSRIQFSIRPARAWNPEINDREKEPRRSSDVYVFCVLGSPDSERPDPMDMDAWRFFVAQSTLLDERFGEQKTVGLSSLEKVAQGPVSSENLAAVVHEAMP
jgi:hypothetical protein